MTLRVGFGMVTCQLPPWAAHSLSDEYAETLQLARIVEEMGFDSIWVSEHHLAADSYLPSAMVMLGALGAVTTSVSLGTGVVLAPLHDPVRFAEDCAVVQLLSGGRLIVGLGVGWRKKEFEAFGVPTSERARRTERLVAACRRAWSSLPSDPQGLDEVAGGLVTPKPGSPIPLMLGGTAAAPIARAARLGDGYLGSPHNDLEAFRDAVRLFDLKAAEAGRDPSRLSLGLHVNAWVSPDGEIPPLAVRAMWHQIGTYAAWHREDDGGSQEEEVPPLDMSRLRTRTISGSPSDVVRQCEPWIREFAEREFHMIFRLHYPGMRAADAAPVIRTFAKDVIPKLREIKGS